MLGMFCNTSGQKVNVEKTKIFLLSQRMFTFERQIKILNYFDKMQTNKGKILCNIRLISFQYLRLMFEILSAEIFSYAVHAIKQRCDYLLQFLVRASIKDRALCMRKERALNDAPNDPFSIRSTHYETMDT